MRPDYKIVDTMVLVTITASILKMLELYVPVSVTYNMHRTILYTYCIVLDDAVGPYPIRLVGGVDETEGRVEIFYDGEWGTVCDDIWGLRDAHVVCREIGCPNGATQAVLRAGFGQGTGTIWLDNVQCTGTELYLSDCPHNGWNSHNCVHGEDAGVRCNMTGRYTYIHTTFKPRRCINAK